MKVLVTGGCGYIGSFATASLLAAGHEVTVLDSLEKGKAVNPGAKLIKGKIGDKAAVRLAMKGCVAVMHFAGYIEVAESVAEPQKYYQNNFIDATNVLNVMVEQGVKNIVFSSTAAVYGSPEKVPIPETARCKPINPYGASKRMFEEALFAYEVLGIRHVILRYFNVCGAAPDGSLGEAHSPETHLIPNVLSAAKAGKSIKVFGNDYGTPDGTCIRDYVHVQDLADAHVLALNFLVKKKRSDLFNIGSQKGYSVLEVIKSCERATGKTIPIAMQPRRPGDPAKLIAGSKKIKRELEWKPLYGLDEITRSAWKWHQKN